MKLKSTFLDLVRRWKVPLPYVSLLIGLTPEELTAMIESGESFDEIQSERLIQAFGAAEMLKVIDWEGMHVRCPV